MNLTIAQYKLLNFVVLIDGFFHLFGFPDIIQQFGPDWIIARGLFDTVGLPIFAHRIIGVFLIAYSSYILLDLYGKISANQSLKIFYRKYIFPTTLIVIIVAIGIKISLSI